MAVITVATEVMAIFVPGPDLEDLKQRFGRMLVAYTYDRKPAMPRD